MKRIFLLVLLSVPFLGISQWKFGPVAGMNVSTIIILPESSESEDILPKFGFSGGGIVQYSLSEKIDLRSELLIETKGYQTELYFINNTVKEVYSIVYLTLPINALFYIPSSSKNFSINTGVYFGYGLQGTRFYSESSTGSSNEYDIIFGKEPESEDIDPFAAYLNPFDFGLNFGLNYETKFGLLISLNYSQGFVNMAPYFEADQGPDYNRWDEEKRWNSTVALKVAWLFECSK